MFVTHKRALPPFSPLPSPPPNYYLAVMIKAGLREHQQAASPQRRPIRQTPLTTKVRNLSNPSRPLAPYLTAQRHLAGSRLTAQCASVCWH